MGVNAMKDQRLSDSEFAEVTSLISEFGDWKLLDLAAEVRRLRNLYEPPEQERDETLVCAFCGSEKVEPLTQQWRKGETHWCTSHSGSTRLAEKWRYLAAQRVLNGVTE